MLKNKTKKVLLLLVLSISIGFLSCKQFMKTNEYKYDAYASCDDKYPIDVSLAYH